MIPIRKTISTQIRLSAAIQIEHQNQKESRRGVAQPGSSSVNTHSAKNQLVLNSVQQLYSNILSGIQLANTRDECMSQLAEYFFDGAHSNKQLAGMFSERNELMMQIKVLRRLIDGLSNDAG